MATFAEQPNEILDMLLNTAIIPLSQRMRLRAVSRRWLPVLEDGLARETTLVIRNTFKWGPPPQADDLVIQRGILTEEIIRTLVRLFPAIIELTLALIYYSKREHRYTPARSWRTVPSLLAQMGTTVTSVKLYGKMHRQVVEPVARALTDMANLTMLDLDGSLGPLLPHLGPVLSRLEAFGHSDIGSAPASIVSSSLSPRCTHLQISQQAFASFTGPFLAQLSASLTHLKLVSCGDEELDTNFDWGLLSRFHGLTSLVIDFLETIDFDPAFLANLASFTRLTDFKLFDSVICHVPLALPSKTEKPLSTIKRLTLVVDLRSGSDSPVDYPAFFQAISSWFPSLSKMTVIARNGLAPTIRANIGKLPFAVEVRDYDFSEIWLPDW